MKKLLVVGVIVLFLGLAIAPSINANIGELSVDIPQENDTLQFESEFQRIRAYLEMKSDEDCGCDDANTTEWDFPVICNILELPFIAAIILYNWFDMDEMKEILVTFVEYLILVGLLLKCPWVPGPSGAT